MNKILEAILRGILMGLEIQDDELDLPIFQGAYTTSGYHADRADQLRWLRENFVDLGLPSGIKWCKWNLGATNGDTPESWYGDYYAWGEVETKDSFYEDTYKYCNVSAGTLTKYNAKDRKVILDPEDDAVKIVIGNEFTMPTKEDFEELCSLPSEWVENYNGVKGLKGRIFTGNNGNELFIPAAGNRYVSEIMQVGSCCEMWSSSGLIDYPGGAYNLYFDSGYLQPLRRGARESGLSVRGVLKTN